MDDDAFFDAIHEMKDVEADFEIRLRRDNAILESNMLKVECDRARGHEKHLIGVEIAKVQRLISRLNHELHIIAQRNEGQNWRKAVKAVCGDEAYLQVVLWIEHEGVKLGKQGG